MRPQDKVTIEDNDQKLNQVFIFNDTPGLSTCSDSRSAESCGCERVKQKSIPELDLFN
jgi:hypothetical protein